MVAYVKRVLMALSLIFVLEPVVAELTAILLLVLVCTVADQHVSSMFCAQKRVKCSRGRMW